MRIILLSLIMSVSASFALAQPGMGGGPPDPESMAERMTERMTEHLSLTETQVPEVYAINLKYAQLRAEVRENADTREAAQMKMKSLNTEMLKEFAGVLDEEQMAMVEEHHAQQQGRRGRKGRGGNKGGPEDPR